MYNIRLFLKAPCITISLRVDLALTLEYNHQWVSHEEDPYAAFRSTLAWQRRICLRQVFKIVCSAIGRNIGPDKHRGCVTLRDPIAAIHLSWSHAVHGASAPSHHSVRFILSFLAPGSAVSRTSGLTPSSQEEEEEDMNTTMNSVVLQLPKYCSRICLLFLLVGLSIMLVYSFLCLSKWFFWEATDFYYYN